MKNFKSDFSLQVRREKISERMKFLQDLVPGCSKVASKFHYVIFLSYLGVALF